MCFFIVLVMKYIIKTILLCGALGGPVVLGPGNVYAENNVSVCSLPYWKDIQTVSVNKETPRSAFMTYPDKNTALTLAYEKSPYYQLLNGTWKFYFVNSYKDLILLPVQTTGMTFKFRGTGNDRVSALPFIPIMDTNSRHVIRNHRYCQKKIRLESIGGISKFRQIGTDEIFTYISQEPNQERMSM